jgi:fibronectin type 3 domain-containing protein
VIAVSWNQLGGAAGYKLYRSGDDSAYALLTTVNAPTAEWADTALQSATEYFYKVSAVNGIGEGPQSAAASAETRIAPPVEIHASPLSAASAEVSWSAAAGAANYRLYRSISADAGYTPVTTTAATTYTDTGLDSAMEYYYKVAAANAAGEGPQSAAFATVIFSAPAAPTGLAALPLSASSLQITWDAVPGAAQYKVYHSSTTATGTYNLAATASATNYTHSGLTVNTNYYYKISAVNNIGEGAQSEPLSAKIAAPATPTGLTVTPLSHASLQISWDAVPGAALYSVYRGGSILTSVTATSHIDTGLDPFRSYSYRIAAVNDIGTGTQATAVSAYTQPIPLSDGVWYSRTTYASYASYYDYYSFPVTGGNYYIQWGNVGHTGEASTNDTVSSYWKSDNSMTNLTTSYFVTQTNGLANPRVINAPRYGYIIVMVFSYYGYYAYDIRFYRE